MEMASSRVSRNHLHVFHASVKAAVVLTQAHLYKVPHHIFAIVSIVMVVDFCAMVSHRSNDMMPLNR